LTQVELTPNDLDKLQQLPVKQLLAAIEPALKKVDRPAHPLLDRYGFGPVVDGHDLPHNPFDPAATDISADIPIMVGGTKDENAIFLAPDNAVWNRTLSDADLKEQVGKIAGADTDQVLAAYRQAYPKMNPAELLITITTASNFWVRSVILAERKAAQGKAPVFMYSFNWETPVFDGKLRSPHSIDVPFAFDTTEFVNNNDHSPTVQAIAAAESATWAAFARAGVPDNKAIPHWPPYDVQSRATMMINAEWKVENDPAREARLMWEKIALA
jgi:para-nitrobenzyl esterase